MKYSWRFYLRVFKDKIKYLFFPRNRWLTKSIPREWRDLDYLFETVILNGIKFYVENDLGKDRLFDKDLEEQLKDVPWQLKTEKELRYIYKLVTINLPKLEKELKDEWDKIPHTTLEELKTSHLTYEEKYGKVDELEEKIGKLKTFIMVWAVKNRASLWT